MNHPMIQIDKREIGKGFPCFIIAELSANHHQKYEEAVKLVQAAAKAGADAIKLQTYTSDTITINSNKEWFSVGGKDHPEEWQGKTLWGLYQEAYTPWEWQPKLKKVAEDLGLILFSSVFDDTSVDFLEKMQVPCYKIASYEIVNTPLIKKVAATGKPVIISIGFASEEEVELAIQILRENGVRDIVALHCVTAYSDKPRWKDTNLSMVADIENHFGVVGGFSDNNAGIELPVLAATTGGASVIEKHFILRRSDGGLDAKFSIEPEEFKQMVFLIRRAEREGSETVLSELGVSKSDLEDAMGKVYYGPASPQEEENKAFRPSLWVKESMKKGEHFTKENVRIARPGAGLPPKYLNEILGKTSSRDIEKVTPLSWDLVE